MAREISPVIEARSLADHCVGLAISLADAERCGYGVYADAARHEIGNIKRCLGRIEAAVAKMPTLQKGGA
ncbi:hypothetical protein [Brevundimonas balnearis]|uniref:Uncharacterized protein n=1 Tax=Brevundimonas balnearis TaxID=1572858 RepID=A0ABV6R0W5_9CAUL